MITRIFGLVINGTKTDGLVPYADMLNHRRFNLSISFDEVLLGIEPLFAFFRPRETKWTFDDNREGFTITSLKTMHRGDQVLFIDVFCP